MLVMSFCHITYSLNFEIEREQTDKSSTVTLNHTQIGIKFDEFAQYQVSFFHFRAITI